MKNATVEDATMRRRNSEKDGWQLSPRSSVPAKRLYIYPLTCIFLGSLEVQSHACRLHAISARS